MTPHDASEGDVNLSPLRAAWRAGLDAETRALLDADERHFLRQSLSTPCLDTISVGGATPSEAETRADRLIYACLRRGLSFKVGGGNVATLCPPLTIAEADLDAAFGILDASLAEVS